MSDESEERQRLRNEDQLLDRLVKVLADNSSSREQAVRVDERTTHLSTALTELKRMHENGSRDMVSGLAAVQKANETETSKVLAAMKDHMADDKSQFDGHNTRLSTLENWKSNMMGRLAMIGIICGLVAGLVGFLLNKFF